MHLRSNVDIARSFRTHTLVCMGIRMRAHQGTDMSLRQLGEAGFWWVVVSHNPNWKLGTRCVNGLSSLTQVQVGGRTKNKNTIQVYGLITAY